MGCRGEYFIRERNINFIGIEKYPLLHADLPGNVPIRFGTNLTAARSISLHDGFGHVTVSGCLIGWLLGCTWNPFLIRRDDIYVVEATRPYGG